MFGFGKGKIKVIIPKSNYTAGEEISGTVTMDLKKPVNARQLVVSIFAVRVVSEYRGGRSHRREEKVFNFDVVLDGEKEYPARSTYNYPFKIQVPTNAVEKKPEPGVADGIMKAVSVLSGRSSSTRWFIEAKLDIPNAFDINKKIQISVSSPEQGPIVN